VGCSVRTNRHGYLAFRLYFEGLESHEGTKLKATQDNRRKAEARARVIDQEIRDGTFDYLRWFPRGNLAARFLPERESAAGRIVTVRGFFYEWSAAEGSRRAVTAKWQRNRESYIRAHVVPAVGSVRLDELTPKHLVDLQTRLRRQGLAASTIDRVIHSALRGMLRDAELAGYRAPDLGQLFDRRFVTRLDQGSDAADIDPYTDQERERILDWFARERRAYHAFVYFRFWTGTRPSEAIALRWGDVDLSNRRIRIRRSRVLGEDGRPKTGRSKRDVVVHEGLENVLRAHMPRRPAPETSSSRRRAGRRSTKRTSNAGSGSRRSVRSASDRAPSTTAVTRTSRCSSLPGRSPSLSAARRGRASR
jgi:integrase